MTLSIRSLLLASLALIVWMMPNAFVEAGGTVSRNVGDAMPTISWDVGGAPNCGVFTNYPATAVPNDVRAFWYTLSPAGNSSSNFGGRLITVTPTTNSSGYVDYNFTCTAGTASDTTTLRVCNNTTHSSDGGSGCVDLPPVITAGDDRSIIPPTDSTNTINASAEDPGGGPITIVWTLVSNPPGSTPSIVGGNTISPNFENLTVSGTYTFRLQVTDSNSVTVNDDMNVVVQPAPPAACVGPVFPPANSSVFAGDQVGFIGDRPFVYSAVDTAAKCEFSCNPAYWWNGGSCVLPDLSALNTSPASGASFSIVDDIIFTGTANNSAVAPVSEGGWADLEIDVNNDSFADSNYNAYGPTLGSFTQGQSKVLTRTLNAGTLPAGSYRYRFHVDTDGTGVVESNDGNPSNNQSAWLPFTVFIPVPSSPSGVTAVTGTCGGVIDVAWGASTFADTYEISLNGGTSWPYTGIAATSYTITGLPVNTTYNDLVVRARNAVSGPSSASSPAVTATASNYCGDLNITSCPLTYIQDGQATCPGNIVNWNMTGATPATSNITRLLPLPVTALDTGNVTGGPLPITLYYGANQIAARDNNIIVQDRTLNVACRPESFFHNDIGTCLAKPEIEQVTAVPIVIRSGNTASIRYRIRANYDLRCSFSGAILAAPIDHNANGDWVTYPAVTTNILTAGQIVRMSCNTRPNAYMATPAQIDTRINVLPAVQEN